MSTHHYLALDLGAESGRVMLGTLSDGKLTLEELHRFPNLPINVLGSIRWNVLRIFDELKTGLGKAAARKLNIEGISTDSWGVDYVLMRGNEPFLTLPFNYRDSRTDGGIERADKVVPTREIFAETGIQFMTLNTLYQLHDDIVRRPEILNLAERFLPIADYINFMFSGVAKCEVSLASTTQVYNPTTRSWSAKLIEAFKFPKRVFPELVPSGTVLGGLRPEIAAETGLTSNPKVIATLSHDTGAAVAGVPGEGTGWAYLSSGTWSLLGIESPEPCINETSRKFNFTNEVGYGHTIRFLRNIIGLWIVQESRRQWAKEGTEYNYAQLVELAAKAEGARSFVNPDSARFGKPGEMPEKIAAYCRETGQPVPRTHGETLRAVFESLALLYGRKIGELRQITGKKIERLHIVGGGSQNDLLNQMAADATGLPVYAGPVEATAIGNILVQALALGHVSSLEEVRATTRRSFPLKEFKPSNAAAWAAARERFEKLPAL